MAEMYSMNHEVSYKLHVIKQTVNTITATSGVEMIRFYDADEDGSVIDHNRL